MILFSSHFANSDEGGEGEKTGPLFLVIVTNWKKGHRCRAALTDTQSRADGGRATLPDFRSVLCIQKYSRAGRAEAVILSIHLGIVSQTEVTFFCPPSLPVIVSLGMPDLSFTCRRKKEARLLGHFSKNFLQKCHTSNIGRRGGTLERKGVLLPTLSLGVA